MTSRAKKKTKKQWRVENISVKPFYFLNELVTPGLAGWRTVLWLFVSSHWGKNARWCWWRNGDVLRVQAGDGNAAWSKTPPHSSLPPSTILYLCLQEDGSATGHEYTMGTVVWTLCSRKLKTGFHHTLDRKLLDTWRSAWAETCGTVREGNKRNKTMRKQQCNELCVSIPACWPWCGTTRRSWWWRCIPLVRQCCSAHERRGCRQRLRH